MKLDIFNKVKPFFNKVGFEVKKHSPEILIGVGIIGVVASAVTACVATTKIPMILEKSKNDISAIHDCKEQKPEEYSEHDAKKDLTAVYLRTGFEFVKLYAPSVIIGSLSLTSIITSNHILRERNIALAAAYTTLDNGFKEYRANVVERFGEEVDKELKYGIKAKKVLEKVVDPKTGEETTVEKEVKVASINGNSQYARVFDLEHGDYDLMFLKAQESYANDMLQAQGYLFLNDVYDKLGLPRTKAGQIVGWVYNKDNPKGDNYVDFGLQNLNVDDGEGGYVNSVVLDFNVDGPIMDCKELL